MIHPVTLMPAPAADILFGKKKKQKPETKPNPPITDSTEFYQGLLPNCQFLAATLMAMQFDPDAIRKLQQEIPDGHRQFSFPGAPDIPVTVRANEITPKDWSRDFRPGQVKAVPDIRAAETAYARLLKALYPDRFQNINDNNIRSLFNFSRFDPEFFTTAFAYHILTGKKLTTWVKPDPTGETQAAMKEALTRENRNWKDIIQSEKQYETPHYNSIVNTQLVAFAENPGRYGVSFVSSPIRRYERGADWGRMLPAYHVYVVDEVDLKKHRVSLINPHNSRFRIVLPFEDMQQYFIKMYVADHAA